MPARVRLLFSILSLTPFLLCASTLYRQLHGPGDIWWTPYALQVPLDQSRERVEIYVRGKSLATLLASGQLRIAEDAGASAVAERDLGLRFNNCCSPAPPWVA
jgi:hypothetical protein